jgi:hypothetical protein
MTSVDDNQTVREIRISIQARSKSGRYYGSSSFREKLKSLEGALFQDESGTYYLRTSQKNSSQRKQRVVLIFEVAQSTVQVITQTSDHYDWDEFEHVQAVPFSMNINGESDNS